MTFYYVYNEHNIAKKEAMVILELVKENSILEYY